MLIIYGKLSVAAVAVCLMAASCGDKLDIQRGYDFSLSSWYLQSEINPYEVVEIRFYLDRTGYVPDHYTLTYRVMRYFQ